MIIELLFIIYLTILAAAVGRIILEYFKFDFCSFIEEFVFSTGIGLSVIVFSVWGLGQLGLLYAWFIWLIILVFSILLFNEFRFFVVGFVRTLKKLASLKLNLFSYILLIFLFITLIMTTVGSLAPPTGNDALTYHLAWPRYFAREHSIFHVSYSRTSLWPYFMEMLFTLGIILKNGIVAKLFHLLMGILTALSVFSFSRRYFNLQLSIMASTICFLTPGIFTQATYAYVDLASTFFMFLSVYSFFLWFNSGSKRWIVLVGVFCGITMSVKYMGVHTCITLMLGLLVAIFCSKKLRLTAGIKIIMIFAGFIILVAMPWYVKSFVILDNPVYPFMAKLFGGTAWKFEFPPISSIGMGSGFARYIFAPWSLTMYPGNYGGEESQIGPLFISIIPAVFIIRRVETPLKYLIVFSLTFFVLWLLGYHVVRYLTPIVPMMSLALVFIYKEIISLRGESFSKFISLFILFCLGVNTCLCIYYNRSKIWVAFGIQSKDSYLSRKSRSYGISKYVNLNLPKDSKIMAVNVPHLFYFDRTIFREEMIWIASDYDKNNHSPEEVTSWLKEKDFTHVLVRKEDNKNLDYRGSVNRITYLLSNDRFKAMALNLCHSEKFASEEGNESTYSLYKIKG